MTCNSRKAWKTIRKLSNDPTTSNPLCLVSANQVAHQLLVNGRGTMPSKPKRHILSPATERDCTRVGEGGVSWRVFSYIDYIFYANYLYSPN